MHRLHIYNHFSIYRLFSAGILFLLLSGLSSQVSATSVLPMTLAQLAQQATTIFYAKVLTNRVALDKRSGQVVTFTDFQILDSIKGKARTQYTIKQLGGKLPGSQYTLHVYGIPSFTVGREYVVFLPAPSKLGFCSPLGLYQGRFNIETIQGEKIISNGRDYRPATTTPSKLVLAPRAVPTKTPTVSLPLATNPDRPSQARLSDFIYSIRTLAAKK